MAKLKKIEKSSILYFFFFLTITLIVLIPYFKGIYSPDGYYIHYESTYFLETILGNLRPIQALIYLLFLSLHLTYAQMYLITTILSTIFLTLTIFLVYKKIYTIWKSNHSTYSHISYFILALGCLTLFLNRYLTDNMIFLENHTMTLATLLAVIASIVYTSNRKYKTIITFVLLLLSEFSYQTMIVSFVLLVVLYHIIDKNTKKITLPYLLKLIVLILIPMILLYLFSYLLKYFNINILDRTISFDILTIIRLLLELLVNILRATNLYIFYPIITIVLLYILNGKKVIQINLKQLLLKLSFLFTLCILLTCSFTLINYGVLSNRMALGIGMIPGICLIFFISHCPVIKSKFILAIMFLTPILELAFFYYFHLVYFNHTKLEEQNVQYIAAQIDNYTKQTGIEVTSIAFYEDKQINTKIWNAQLNNICRTDYPNTYQYDRVIYGYSPYHLEEISCDEQIYQKYFKDKDWDSFSTEQLVFVHNTLHLCKY